MERLILLHKKRHPDKCLELRATVDGKHMYERLGFSVFREIHEASEGDLYDMRLYHCCVWLQTGEIETRYRKEQSCKRITNTPSQER